MKTKSRKADLEGKKTLFFQVGLIIALSLALAAFEWPSKGNLNIDLLVNTGPIDTPEDVVITRPDKIIPPPPPVIAAIEVINIRPDTDILIENPNLFEDFKAEDIKFLLNPPEEADVIEETIEFFRIEEKPSFMDGDHNAFTRWVAKNLNYPDEAARNGIQGKVILQFLIDVDGSVNNVVVIRGIDPLLDAEAVRIVSMSPKWKPGKQRGVPTKVRFTFPLTFRLH
jgi:periplasmic protein TonB